MHGGGFVPESNFAFNGADDVFFGSVSPSNFYTMPGIYNELAIIHEVFDSSVNDIYGFSCVGTPFPSLWGAMLQTIVSQDREFQAQARTVAESFANFPK